MAPDDGRDDAAVVAGLARWLARTEDRPDLTLTGFHRPSAGYSSDTILIDAAWSTGGIPHHEPLVIRMGPPGRGTFPHYDLVSQWQAQTAAAAAGVPVADPIVEADDRWLGAPFMVMRRVDGHIIGALAHRDRWLRDRGPDDQRRLYRNFIATLSRIHRADPARHPACHAGQLRRARLLGRLPGVVECRLTCPTLVDALAWCRATGRRRAASRPCCGVTPASRTWSSATTSTSWPCSTGT